ncbi:ABC transporter ATP-binding protein [Actinopolyspora mortivallis]|uniref:ABC transporter domain-containing protein n=1 Tax=Actinopolyspora mortivallis TaxID=33906 RepID=A0A2T0GVV3_ACTMO|nr:ATP-binding cassette domain-containing protein [Actinopolyspora mortivallis]PRW63239.1 hypothetical protein CEP50_11180 [Actinopolyspora mortivallis]
METPNRALLETEKLGKRFGGHWAVRDIDLTVRSGHTVGIVGPNGAGKTTLLATLLGLIEPSAGKLHHHTAGRGTRPGFGAVLDQDGLINSVSGRRNLDQWAGMLGGVTSKEVDECLDAVGMRQAARKRVGTYSLGMRRRLCLARALLGDPEVLVLDEPGNGLDPAGIIRLKELIGERARAGTGVIFSSHSIADVDEMSDEIVYISGGEVVTRWTEDSPQWWRLRFAGETEAPEDTRHAAATVLKEHDWTHRIDPYIGVLAERSAPLHELLALLSRAQLPLENVEDLGRDIEQPFRGLDSW